MGAQFGEAGIYVGKLLIEAGIYRSFLFSNSGINPRFKTFFCNQRFQISGECLVQDFRLHLCLLRRHVPGGSRRHTNLCMPKVEIALIRFPYSMRRPGNAS